MLKLSSIIALFTLLLLVVTGCNSASTPPGFARVGGVLQQNTSQSASPNAVYSLMEWYTQANTERKVPQLWSDYVQSQRNAALNDLNALWQKNLIARSSALLKADPVKFLVIDPSALSSRTNWSSINAQLHSLKLIIEAPRTFPVPVKECSDDSFWNENSQSTKEQFLAWAHQRSLTVPLPDGFDKDAILKQLNEIQNAVQVKKHIVGAIHKANALTAGHHYQEALDLLDKTRASYAANDDALQALQDSHTIQMLNETFNDIPIAAIKFTLDTFNAKLNTVKAAAAKPFDPNTNSVNAVNAQLAEIETRLTTEFNHWQTDIRFQSAREKFKKQIKDTTRVASEVRFAIWNFMLDTHVNNNSYWDVALAYSSFQEALTTASHKQFGLYALAAVNPNSDYYFSHDLAQKLKAKLTQMLPNMLGALATAADMAQNVNRKPGYALALSHMAHDIVRRVGPQQDAAIRTPLGKLDEIAKNAKKNIEDTVLKRVIAMSDMASAVPGLGLTYTKDVVHALTALIRAFKLDKYVTVATTTVPVNQYSYSLFDGVVADFNGNEAIERQNVRIIRRFGEIKKSPNPEAQKDATKPPMIYTQEVYEQVINVREIERLAHVRAFLTMRGPGFTTLIEVNEFYSKQFIIEDSHPFNDLRVIDVLKTYDLAKHPVQDAAPTLQYDRVWTPGEMLDWARKDSLKVFTLKLLFHINQFPFLLENQAKHLEQTNNLTDAVEFWAYCFTLTNELNPDAADFSNVLNETSKPAAKCYDQCVNDLRQQRIDLATLKRNTPDQMLLKANQLFKNNAN